MSFGYGLLLNFKFDTLKIFETLLIYHDKYHLTEPIK